jgi:hypothetical protein
LFSFACWPRINLGFRWLPDANDDSMFDEFPAEWDDAIYQSLSIHFHPDRPSLAVLRVLHLYFVGCFPMTERDLIAIPPTRNSGIDSESVSPDMESENLLHPCAVHQCGRPCVPGPSSFANPPGEAIHVGRNDVWLNPVAPDSARIACVFDGIEHPHHLSGPGTITASCHSHGQPDRGVGVLSPVFPHTRRISLDVPGRRCHGVDRRFE